MTSRFSIILDMLNNAFTNPINETEYHGIVECLRIYSSNQDPIDVQQEELKKRGWPLNYHPCDHMENIRHAFTFVPNDQTNIGVEVSICKFHLGHPSS